MRRLLIAVAVAGLLSVGACTGADAPSPVPAPSTSAAATAPATLASSPSTTPTPSDPLSGKPSVTDPDPSRTDCGTTGGLQLTIVNGHPPCADVLRVAAAYDLEGDKVQPIEDWTCAGGTAATRPIVFTCTRETDEFTASEG